MKRITTIAKRKPVFQVRCRCKRLPSPWSGIFFVIWVICAPFPAVANEIFTKPARTETNQIVICLPKPIQPLDPTGHRSRITQIVLKNIFDSLTTRNNNNEAIPQLAESWHRLDDSQWLFRLRKDVHFHNGQKLVADDVKFTIERVIHEGARDGETSPRKNLLAPVSEVTAVDEHTVVIKTHHPWPILPLMLSLQEIVPATYVKAVGTLEFIEHPVGTGPFKVVKIVEDKKTVILERFEGYYGGSPLKPPVQTAPLNRVIFKAVPYHIDQLSQLKTGQCDVIFNLPPESVPIAEMSPDIRVLRSSATRSYFAEINCAKPPFDDIRIRQALNYAVDMKTTVTQKVQGKGKVLSTILLPNAFGFDPNLQPYSYEPDLATELLEEAGYPKSRPVTIFSSKDDLVFASTISLYLTKIGLRTKIIHSSSFRPQMLGANAPWDIFIGSWGNSTLDPTGILPPKFKSRASGNFSGFSSSALDTLFLEAQRTLDMPKRVEYYHQIQAIIHKEAPMIFGYAQDEYYAVNKRVKHFTPSFTGMIELHDVHVEQKE